MFEGKGLGDREGEQELEQSQEALEPSFEDNLAHRARASPAPQDLGSSNSSRNNLMPRTL